MTVGLSLSGNASKYGDCNIEGTVYDDHGCKCGSADDENLKVIIGIAIHIVGSVGINVGQNLQAIGLNQLPEEDRQTCGKICRNKKWVIGCSLFIAASLVNFLMLMLAPASILVPLEAVQFVVNVAFGRFVRKVHVPPRMLVGTVLMCGGIALVVVFGERGIFCFDEEKLKNFWRMPDAWGWWLYCAVTFAISAVCLVLHERFLKQKRQGKGKIANYDLVMPVLYAMPSALLGGGQMIVQSKTLAELLEIMGTGSDEPGYTIPLAGWFFYVELLLVCGFGMFWFYRLSTSLGLYDPLFIIPLMQSFFMVFGGVAGGIFFGEFKNLHVGLLGAGNWIMYFGGLSVVFVGLYLVRPAEDPNKGDEESGPKKYPATEVGMSATVPATGDGKVGSWMGEDEVCPPPVHGTPVEPVPVGEAQASSSSVTEVVPATEIQSAEVQDTPDVQDVTDVQDLNE